MTTRAKGRGEQSPADDEFLQQLYRGGELLAAGKVIEAKEFLERAHQLQPRHEKAQNLLGLCYFKLGLFDRAAELYEMLVRDNPVDPTLRVNLGLVYLKTSALQRAAREFETATDLAPEHQKAQNYLGLTLAQMGEYGRAREHFLLAGSDAMAEKMTRAIAGEGFSRPAPVQPARVRGFAELEGSEVVREQGGEPVAGAAPAVPPAAPAQPPPAAPEEEEIRLADDEGPSAQAAASGEGDDGLPVLTATPEDAEDLARVAQQEQPNPPPVSATLASVPEAAAVVASPAREESEPDSTFDETSVAIANSVALTPVPLSSVHLGRSAPAPAAAPAPPRTGTAWPGDTAVPPLAELAPSVALAGADATRPFLLGHGSFSVAVDGELLTRLEGVVAIRGQLTFQPELKRFRGRATDKPFGEAAARMVRAKGKGVLYVEPSEKRTFLAVDLGEDSAYFRDECVFAFEEPVMFENGRVPSDIAPDLDLVHLRGQGKVLLSLPGPLRSVQVRADEPVTVPLTHLVGWQGNLAPRVVPLLKSPSGEVLRPGVELSGEGFALIALGVR